MKHRFHFLTGLPRSGSTLLAALLRQNPLFHASYMSPVGQVISDTQTALGPTGNEAYRAVTNRQRQAILRGIVYNFYEGFDKKFIFDNSRRWTANIDLLAKLFPDAYLFATVREPRAIVDSLERASRAFPEEVSLLVNEANTTVYDRVSGWLGSNAVLGFALNGLRSAMYGAHKERLCLIEYDDLARFPQDVLNTIHQKIGCPPFSYDVKNVKPIEGAEEFDKQLGSPGLHSVKSVVELVPRNSILPPDIFQSLPPPFWRESAVKKVITVGR